MPAISRLGVQCAQNFARRFQRIDRLEQRRHVERTLAGALVRDIGPSRQQQDGENVLGTPGTADDVLANGAPAEFMPRLRDGFKHPEAAAADRVQCAGRSLITDQKVMQPPQALLRGQIGPVLLIQPLRDDLIMQAGMLNHVQRRQMKPECPHAPHEPPHQKVSGVTPAILEQAIGRQPHIRQQLIGILIRIGPPFVGCLQALADLAEEDAVRHAIVARRRQGLRARQNRRVAFDALGQLGAHADAIRALTQGLGQLPALGEIRRYDQLLVPVQRLADGLAMNVGVAVHVAAHP